MLSFSPRDVLDENSDLIESVSEAFPTYSSIVNTLHRCSYDNSTISSVNKLKTIWHFSPFSHSFTFLSFTYLFYLFCFLSLCQRVVLLNLLDTKMNPNCLLFSQRARERERERERVGERGRGRKSPKSSRDGVVGWGDGAG